METRELLLVIKVLSGELDKAEATIQQLGQQAGLSATQVDKVSKSLNDSSRSAQTFATQANNALNRVTALETKSKQLGDALKKATDAKEVAKLNRELSKTDDELKKARIEAVKLGNRLIDIGSQGKKNKSIFDRLFDGLDFSKLKGAQGIQNIFNALGIASGGVSGGLISLAGSMGPLGAAIGAVIGVASTLFDVFSKSVVIAKDYENALADLSAVTGLTGGDLDTLSELAQNFSINLEGADGQLIKITKSATETATAFGVVGSEVPKLLNSPEALDAVTRSAAVLAETSRSLDFETAISGVTSLINAFVPAEATFEEVAAASETFVNQIARAQQIGSISGDKLAASLSNFQGVAAASNLTSAETIALAEASATAFRNQSAAGTSISAVLTKLSTDTGDVGKAFNDAANDSNRTFAALTVLKGELDAIADPSARSARILEFFGETGRVAGLKLLESLPTLDEYNAKLREQEGLALNAGAANEQAAANANTLANAQNNLNNALTKIQLEIGNKLIPVLADLAVLAERIISRFGEATGPVDDLNDSFAELFNSIASLLTELGLLDEEATKSGESFDFLGASLSAVAVFLETVISPTRILIDSLTSAVDAWRYFVAAVKGASTAVSLFQGALGELLTGNLDAFNNFGEAIRASFVGEFDKLKKDAKETATDINESLAFNLLVSQDNEKPFSPLVESAKEAVKETEVISNSLKSLKDQITKLKAEREIVDVDTSRFKELTSEINKLEKQVNKLEGKETKIKLTADQESLKELVKEINKTKAQLNIAVSSNNQDSIDSISDRLSNLNKLKTELEVRIKQNVFDKDIEDLQKELLKFQRDTEDFKLNIQLETAQREGNFTQTIDLIKQQFETEAKRAKDDLERDPVFIELLKVDPAQAEKLREQFAANLDAQQIQEIKEATKIFTDQTAKDFVDNLIDSYTNQVSASGSEFQQIGGALTAKLTELTQSLQIVSGAGSLGEARTLLDTLGLDPDSVLGDSTTINEAVEKIKGAIKGAQKDLLTGQSAFAKDFIKETEILLSGIETEINRIKSLSSEELTPADTETLQLLQSEYARLQQEIAKARDETIALDGASKSVALTFEDAFSGASDTALRLGGNLKELFDELDIPIDPGKLRVIAEGYSAILSAADALFAFQAGKASAVNEEEIAALDERIEKEEERARKSKDLTEEERESQAASLEKLNKQREALLEERAEKERQVQLRQFRFNQAVQVAEAIVENAGAFVKTLNSGLPFPANVIAAGLVAATGAAQIATILAARPQFFEGERFVKASPGKMGKDSIDARIHHGERVTDSDTNKAYFNDLNTIEDRKVQPGAVTVFGNLPKQLQNLIVNDPDFFIKAAKGGDDQFTQLQPKITNRVIKKQVSKMPDMTLSPQIIKTVEKVNRKRSQPVIKNNIDLDALAGKIAENMYKMQHRDSSVDKYHLDATRYGLRGINEKLEKLLNKK